MNVLQKSQQQVDYHHFNTLKMIVQNPKKKQKPYKAGPKIQL